MGKWHNIFKVEETIVCLYAGLAERISDEISRERILGAMCLR
jgi:hypothetical protein